jgi:flagellar protein FliO/FliZ
MLSDWGLLARFLVALAIVLALIAAATWVARRYLAIGVGHLVGKRRLAVLETAMLDGKSRLVLVRRDNTEHLLVLGPAGAAVVESAIPAADAAAGGTTPGADAPKPAAPANLRTLLTGRQ